MPMYGPVVTLYPMAVWMSDVIVRVGGSHERRGMVVRYRVVFLFVVGNGVGNVKEGHKKRGYEINVTP